MEQKHDSVCDQLPPLCAKYPWMVSQDLQTEQDNTGGQIFYTINDPLFHYRCRIPELTGNRIRGCFFGWVILSNNTMWSLWDPVTCKIIHLPPLILKDGGSESIRQCCLSFPPDDPSSVLLLTRFDKPTFVFCRLNRKRKKFKWIEMSYVTQLKRLSIDGRLVHSLTCCDGKVFALTFGSSVATFVIQVDIAVNDKEVVIKLLLFGGIPYSRDVDPCPSTRYFLKGFGSELFCIAVGFYEETKKTIGAVTLFKLDMTNINWEELQGLKDWDMSNKNLEDLEDEDIEDLYITADMWEEMLDFKDALFFVDLARDYSVFYIPKIASELGGYMHIRGEMGKIIHSYCFDDKTISISSLPSSVLPTSHLSLWECRLEGDYVDYKQEEHDKDDEIVVRSIKDGEVEHNESYLLNLPNHILEMIMERCVGLEYMNFRATCKRCHLAAPLIQWRNEASLNKLQNYSLVSPWLMVVDKKQGIITFTDPMFGDKYSMKKFHSSTRDRICCSRFGWLLLKSLDFELEFYNPFTNDTHKLQDLDFFVESFCFSAPPTSPDCLVVGFALQDIYIHFVAREHSWREIRLDSHFHRFNFPTFYGQDIYALCNEGELYVFKDLGEEDYSWERVLKEAPTSCYTSRAQYFTKCDQHLLLVIVGMSRESVEVFKLNDSTKEWEKIDDLGKHMIYISKNTCLCVEAKTREMENKIYFPQLNSKNRKIVFYSLETCTYNTFNHKNIEETFDRTSYHLHPHAWIEPSWS